MRRWILTTVGLFVILTLISCTTTEMTESPTATSAPPTATTAPPSPTATATMEPTPTSETMDVTPTPTEESGDGEADEDVESAEAPALEGDAFANLESYRAQITWETDLAEGAGQEVMIDIAETRDPDARQIAIGSTGMNIEFISTPDGAWVKAGGQWQSVPAGNMESFFGEMTFIAPEDISELADAEEDADYEFVGTETVNGLQTRHYRINVDPEEFRDTTGTTDVQAVEADVWVADESDLPAFAVRFIVQSEVEIEGQTGTATLTWNVQEVNTEFTIEPPEEM